MLATEGTFTEDTMRHRAITLLSALIFATAIASTLRAQTKSSDAAQAQRMSPPNRWVNRPTPLTLTVDQQKKLANISAKYTTEEQQVRKQVSGQSDVDMVLKMMNLSTKYQHIVRGILNPAQQAVFDKNIRASAFGP